MLDYIVGLTRRSTSEELRLFLLGDQRRFLGSELVATGAHSFVQSRFRQVFHAALTHGARAIVIGHNHPSGIPYPSGADILFTQRVLELARALDVAIYDHVITAGKHVYSMALSRIVT